MDFHVEANGAGGVGFIALDAALFILQGLLDIFIDGCMEVSACIDGKLFSVGAKVFVQRQVCFFRCKVVQGYIDWPRQIDREESQVTVDGPEFVPYLFPVMDVTTEHHRSDCLM
ncbi:hypothetical protein SDC9_193829 [bioreactor metagenome]|uniref:Uncharacterized protein n=1 Tax=bioreactor metagenome TaxID=1076179 RepID=A0A645I5S8_9ZZZZ